jgi:hypothetical protein
VNRRGQRYLGIRALIAILALAIAAVVGVIKLAGASADSHELAVIVSVLRSDAAATAVLSDALARGQTGTTFARAQAAQQRRALDTSLRQLISMRVGAPLERGRVQAMEAAGRLDVLLALLERDTLRSSDGDGIAARSREVLSTMLAIERSLPQS